MRYSVYILLLLLLNSCLEATNTGGEEGNQIDIGGMAGNVGGMAGNVGGMAGNVGGMAGNVGGMAGNVGGMAGNVGGMAGNVGGMAGNVGGMAGNVGGMAGNVGGMAGNVGGMAGNVGGMAGNVGGMAGNVGGMAGNVGGMAGNVGGMAGNVGGMAGNVGGMAGNVGGMAGNVGGMAGGNLDMMLNGGEIINDMSILGCDQIQCNLHERCVNIDNIATCICESGYQKIDGQCVDINECAGLAQPCGPGDCSNTEGSYLCGNCASGYRPNDLLNACVDIDECVMNPCGNGSCINEVGSYRCDCQAGYLAVAGRCDDINECQQANICGDHASCENQIGSFQCNCELGYQKIGLSCVDLNECDLGVCGNPMTTQCTNLEGAYRCDCLAGFRLDNGVCTDIDECSNLPCGMGQCLNTLGSYQCLCNQGYELVNGTCVDSNECLNPNICQANSYCENQAGSYQCLCNAGYQIINGVCTDIDECLGNANLCGDPAINLCINEAGTYRCDCQTGYFKTQNGLCADVNECNSPLSSAINQCNQICQNRIGGYQCACNPGYKLDADLKTCIDINECVEQVVCSTSNPPSGACTNTIGAYQCNCFAGYALSNGFCADIDECALNIDQCDQNATCTNNVGAYQCACRTDLGYFGNGLECQTLKQIAVGSNFQCVLTQPSVLYPTSRVFCWGDNSFGQLGDGTSNTRNTPSGSLAVNFGDLGNPIKLELGDTFACAILQKNNNYNIACWGSNDAGQAGQPLNVAFSSSPTSILKSDQTLLSIPNTAGILKLGSKHACLLATVQGLQVYCWGDNSKAQLGNGTKNNSYLANAMLTVNQGFNQVLEHALGDKHSCLLVNNNSNQKEIRCVGETGRIQPSVSLNTAGSDCITGIGLAASSSCLNQPSTPISMPLGTTPLSGLESGANHLIFQGFISSTNTRAYYAFGENTNGQLGNNSNQYSFFPVLINVTWGMKQISQVISGTNSSYLQMTDGSLFSTGENIQGQLLIQSLAQKLSYNSAQSNISQFEAGRGRACALVNQNNILIPKCGGGSHLLNLGIGACSGNCTNNDYTLKNVIWN